jgi:hypothetical protein
VDHHGADDGLAAVGARRLAQSNPGHGAGVLAVKGPYPQVGLQSGQVLPAGFAPLRVGPEGLRLEPELVGEKCQQGSVRVAPLRPLPSWPFQLSNA